MTKAGLSRRMTSAAIASVVAGFALYWLDSDGFTSAWLSSGPGKGFGIGAFFALVGLVAGIMVGRNFAALGQLGAQIQGKPTPEQLQKLQALQQQQALVGRINVYSLILATTFMAIARYLVF
jgi:Na+/glutamate symporter